MSAEASEPSFGTWRKGRVIKMLEALYEEITEISVQGEHTVKCPPKGQLPSGLLLLCALSSVDYVILWEDYDSFYLHPCRCCGSKRWPLRTRSVNTTLLFESSDSEHPHLTMLDGSSCGSSHTASTTIMFVCDTSIFGAGTPTLLMQHDHEDEQCSFIVEWRTHFACPRGERGMAGVLLGGIILL